jgi:hypothetical protein
VGDGDGGKKNVPLPVFKDGDPVGLRNTDGDDLPRRNIACGVTRFASCALAAGSEPLLVLAVGSAGPSRGVPMGDGMGDDNGSSPISGTGTGCSNSSSSSMAMVGPVVAVPDPPLGNTDDDEDDGAIAMPTGTVLPAAACGSANVSVSTCRSKPMGYTCNDKEQTSLTLALV